MGDDWKSVQTITLELPSHPLAGSQDIDFRETSFFSRADAELPSPSQVDARHQSQNHGGRIAIFEELNLVVKRGSPQEGRFDEALTMQALRKAFPDGEVPALRYSDTELMMARTSFT